MNTYKIENPDKQQKSIVKMPRYLQLQDKMVYVPSLSSVTVMTSCFGYPMLSLCHHTSSSPEYIYYTGWDLCRQDFNRVEDALKEIESALSKIPLTQPTGMLADKAIEQNMIELKNSIDGMDKLVKEMKPKEDAKEKEKESLDEIA